MSQVLDLKIYSCVLLVYFQARRGLEFRLILIMCFGSCLVYLSILEKTGLGFWLKKTCCKFGKGIWLSESGSERFLHFFISIRNLGSDSRAILQNFRFPIVIEIFMSQNRYNNIYKYPKSDDSNKWAVLLDWKLWKR